MLKEIFSNELILISFTGLIIAQILKILTYYIKTKKFDISMAFSSGGMPSSHSSTVMALSTSIGLEYGWGSVYFAIALVFSCLVMYDAAGVRLAVGKQAKILNSMIAEIKDGFKKEGLHIFTSKELKTDVKLKEFIGHTKIEVIAGALLGILTGAIMSNFL